MQAVSMMESPYIGLEPLWNIGSSSAAEPGI